MTDSYNRFHALDENDRIDDPDTDLEPSNLSVLNSFGWLLLMETPNKAIQNYPDASITVHTAYLTAGNTDLITEVTSICLSLYKISAYRKTSNRSRVPDRRRAPYTGRGSDSLVPIEAGPRLQAGSRIQAIQLS